MSLTARCPGNHLPSSKEQQLIAVSCLVARVGLLRAQQAHRVCKGVNFQKQTGPDELRSAQQVIVFSGMLFSKGSSLLTKMTRLGAMVCLIMEFIGVCNVTLESGEKKGALSAHWVGSSVLGLCSRALRGAVGAALLAGERGAW